MPKLEEMIGQTIVALIPLIDKEEFQEVKLHGVESGGLWIESQKITNWLLRRKGLASAPKTLVLFLPYHQITFVMSALDVPSLSESAFGV